MNRFGRKSDPMAINVVYLGPLLPGPLFLCSQLVHRIKRAKNGPTSVDQGSERVEIKSVNCSVVPPFVQ